MAPSYPGRNLGVAANTSPVVAAESTHGQAGRGFSCLIHSSASYPTIAKSLDTLCVAGRDVDAAQAMEIRAQWRTLAETGNTLVSCSGRLRDGDLPRASGCDDDRQE